jgi:hypothetical protein
VPFVIGKHHLGRCLHLFTMATLMREDGTIPLNFTPKTILVLKPAPEEKIRQGLIYNFGLKLFNAAGDILLYISFSPTRIIFRDYALRSLGNSWGKEQTMDMNFNQSVTYSDTISIHHYLTHSEFGRYQILLNGITIYHFDKRLPGPATNISYEKATGWAPSYWYVGIYQIDDLLPEDRLALVAGR